MERVRWLDFNEKAELPKGNITIALVTDVYANEKVEWIPSMFGIEITQWATWTEALNVDLRVHYTMDTDVGEVIPDSLGVADLWYNSSVAFVGGKIGNAGNFSQTDQKWLIGSNET